MVASLVPKVLDNNFSGSRYALWILGVLVALKAAMGLNCMLDGASVAASADGIPLDSYGPAGARAFVALFAVWGLGQVLLAALGALVLLRYRAATPLMLTLLLAEQVGRRLIFAVLPIARTGSPPGAAVNLGFLVLMLVGLALSLRRG